MRGALKKAMFHLAWSPDSLPTSDAISPLLEYLDSHLISLNSALLPRNFERVLSVIWDTGLQELAHQMDGHAQDKLPGFYDRLYEALDILTDFFHAEGKGLHMEAIKSGILLSLSLNTAKEYSHFNTGNSKLQNCSSFMRAACYICLCKIFF